MNKIIIKELNRTVLAKEGTKWMYLSAKEFLNLFETTVNELKRSQKNITVYIKDDYLDNDNPTAYNLKLTLATKEIRLFGSDFPDLYEDLGVCECDNLIIENTTINNTNVILFSCNKTKNIVIKKYSSKDIKKTERLNPDFANCWWPWDNHLSTIELNDFFSNEHNVNYVHNGITEKRKIKFTMVSPFEKYMNQANGSVTKTLYKIFEYKNDEWKQSELNDFEILQFEPIENNYQLSPKKTTACIYREID